MKTDDISKENRWKRSVIEWGILISLAVLLYLTGWHIQVIGTIQRGFLATGLIKPDIPEQSDNAESANLNYYFKDRRGTVRSLRNYEGDVIFMNIWATWCPPCIAEMPSIHALYQDLKNEEGISFILVSVDDDFEKAEEFMEKRGYDLPIFHYHTKAAGTYQSSAIPTTYVLSRDSRIVLEHQGYAKYDTEEFKSFLLNLITADS